MDASNVIYVSADCLPISPEQWVRQVRQHDGPEIVIVGLGPKGALIWVRSDNFIERLAVGQDQGSRSFAVDSTILFASFVHSLVALGDPYLSLETALRQASPKATTTSPVIPVSQGLTQD